MPIVVFLIGAVALVAMASARGARSDAPAPKLDGNRYVRSAQGLLEPGVQYEIAAFVSPLPSRDAIQGHLAKEWIGGSIRWYPGDDPNAFPSEIPAVNNPSSFGSIFVTRGIWKGPLTQVDTSENVVFAVNPINPVF